VSSNRVWSAARRSAASAPREARSAKLTQRYAHHPWQAVQRFYWKAFEDNLTGLSAMVAFNLLLSIIPLALVALFVAGQVLQSGDVERSVISDLRRLFPDAERQTIRDLLNNIEEGSTRIGILALVGSVWLGSSFWGAMDTAFCRIYDARCRNWLEQKRFAVGMLGVVLLFGLAAVAVPAIQSFLAAGADDLPFGLEDIPGLIYVVSLAFGLAILFGTLCLIYRWVPNCSIPWSAIWPGALGATLAITVADLAFPIYLSSISTLGGFGTTFVFIVIALFWFYIVAIVLLSGAVINGLRLRTIESRGPTGVAGAISG
jgi:membrane protein